MTFIDVPQHSTVRLLENAATPPAAPLVWKGDVVKFHNIDGMYAFCTNQDGDAVYIAAWTEVEIVDT